MEFRVYQTSDVHRGSTLITKRDLRKKTVINEVCVFPIKCRYSYLLKIHKFHLSC